MHGNVQYGRILFSEKVILSREGECTFLTCSVRLEIHCVLLNIILELNILSVYYYAYTWLCLAII